MTVSTAERATVVSQAGSGGWWGTTSNLLYGSSGSSSATFTAVYLSYEVKDLSLSIPNYLTSLDHGSQFVNLKMSFTEAYSGSGAPVSKAGLTGGTVINNGSVPASTTTREMDGDAGYWGISGSALEIFSGLKDGSIKFIYQPTTVYSSSGDITIGDPTFELTYLEADTRRASIIGILP